MRLLFLLLFVQPSLFFPPPGNPPQQPNPPQTSPIQQNPGQPLPPGSVSYRNTWNQTQPQCAYPKLTSEPLLSRDSNWTIVVNIPTLLLMGESASSYVKHTYTFYANGTFLARDDQGNSFAVKGLGGLPGTAATTLRGNSTMALQNYLWVLGRQTIANVTVSYSVRRQFCQPAGLEIAISGQADWRIAKAGSLSLRFNKPPVKLDAHRAWFGGRNDSRVQLGFDWGDSLQYAPTFDRRLNALSWSVGPTFRIDPQTVSSTGVSTMQQQSRNLWFTNGRWWLFYEVLCGGTFYSACIEVTSSVDGVAWSPPTQLNSIPWGYQPMLSVWVNTRNGHYYYVVDMKNEAEVFVWGHGALNPDGTITKDLSDAYVSFPGVCGPYNTNVISNSVVLDSYQNLFASFQTTTGKCPRGYQPGSDIPSFITVMKWTNSTNSWSTSLNYAFAGSYNNLQAGQLVPLTSGRLGLVNCDTGGTCVVRNYDGSSWSFPATVTTSEQSNWWGGCSFSAVSAGDTTYAALVTASGASFFSYPYGGPAAQVSTIKSTGSDSIQVGLTTDSSGRPFTTVADSTRNTIFTNRSANGGNTWASVNAIAGETNLQNPSLAAVYSTLSLLGLTWIAGSSSPYNIRFAAIPAVIPDAATSTNSWGKAGIAPYSAYFAHLGEYVSPGNGLLTIRQDDLYLPGRGIDLDIARVFSTPYAFRSGSPYQYDNFTLSNLGYGWSLDFPWLGANYLHLPGGQAYPYQWSGNVFEYHAGNDFKLLHNADGTYTLYSRGGTSYQFNGAKQLTAITDHTGNNTLSLTYGPNGYISQMTDAVGRTAVFAYDSKNHLSTISSGGRTWTYSYSGNDLVSVADPLGRVTSFQYNTGINNWLITAVLYPTGGRSMYAYGSAAVGTENVRTYYVTSRNVYSSPTSLSQTSSASYAILDGNVVWSNTTVSDGVSARAYESYNFQTSRNLMKQYEKDSTGAVTRIIESDYDASGRINRTGTFSPSGALLAYSLMYYDNWGNMKHSRNPLGHDVWFSYANTDSQNIFGAPGFTNSFYTPLTVSADIHDTLVGRAEQQNGPGSANMETYYRYDSAGNLLERKQVHNVAGYPTAWLLTDYTYDSYGNRLSTTDALGRVAYSRYSPTYQSAYLTKASILAGTQNVTTTYTYDFVKGLLLSQTDPKGFVTSYSYDLLGRTTGVSYPAVGGVRASKVYLYDDPENILTVVYENGNSVSQYFDGLGRQTSVVAYNGSSVYSSTTYTYNWRNQVSRKVTPTGSVYTYAYDWEGRQVKVTNADGTTLTASYDDVNNVRTVTDENGHQTSYGYDRGGRLVWVRQYTGPTSYYQTSYTYDLSGNLLSTTDPNAAVTFYQYDDLNRLVKTTYPDGTSESRSYDLVGSLVSRTTPAGVVISYSYDSTYRLVKVAYPDSTTLAYSYDADGNLLSMVTSSASTFYAYNARNWVMNQTQVVGSKRYSVLYGYDNAGNIVSTAYPDGYTLSISYDAFNRVRQLGAFATFLYTQDSKLSRISYGDGQVSTYSYDSRERPTRILVRTGSLRQLDLNYTYDSVGNVLSIDGERYSYDWLNRLRSAQGPWLPISYSYDGAGNVVNKTVGTTTPYKYGAYNRLTSAGSVNFAYDANGNTVTKVNGSTSWSYAYDFENRLTMVQKNGVTVAKNLYDGSGSLVVSVEGSKQQAFGYQGMNRIYATNVNASSTADYFYANGLLVASRNASTVSYYQEDAIGSVRLATNIGGSQTYSSDYRPFGTSYGTTGSSSVGYAGKPSDSLTGLYYFGARFYDPTVERFVTEDSVSGAREDPLSLNRYIYARDNPLGITDPTGHDWWSTLTQAVSNAASTFVSKASSQASAIINTWNGLPPPVKIGVAVGALVAIGIATGGLGDVAVLGGAISESAGSIATSAVAIGASAIGLPVITDATETVDISVIESVAPETINSIRGSLIHLESKLGETYVDLQTGDINNVDKHEKFLGASGVLRSPDGVGHSLGEPPIIDDVKVGIDSNYGQASDYNDLVKRGIVRAGTIYFLESPYTGEIGANPRVMHQLVETGFDFVYFKGPWWRNLPE